MKKTFIFLLLLASFTGFSQAVSIDPTYTADQLINNVLINSPCTTGTNVQSSTGTNFGSTNGIGYFENFNPLFPFEKGVVLTTGDVTKVPSPNTTILSDGTDAWPGDADMEANLLSQSGVIIKSINASYIQFDFVAKSPNAAFDFIFASEEYGTSQCNFSDAFAFLLKNVTDGGNNVNLALVPAPAAPNTPISVATIRDALYNPICPSVNPSFFGTFNGGGFGPAINFNGQTKKMTALANGLIVGKTYRIKIVIADGGENTGYDSAIFLNANSFNSIANVLGPDVAFCSGVTLPILQPTAPLAAGTTYQWKKANVVMPGQTGATLNLNTSVPAPTVGLNDYSLTYTEPGCSPLTDEITVEIYAPVGAMATVPPLYLCTSAGPNYNFDLTKVTNTIMTSGTTATGDDLPAATTVISYYLTSLEASNGISGQQSSPHVITMAQNNKTLYARIQNSVTNCYEVRSFQLSIVPDPVINAIPANITLCARNLTDATPRAIFDTQALVATILGGTQNSAIYKVSFHTNLANATNNTGAILPSTTYLSTSRNLWIRVTNVTDPTCFAVSSTFFQLIVTPLPEVDILPDVVVCTSFTLPVLTEAGAQYYTATNAGGTPRAAGYVVTGAPGTSTTMHVYNESGICKANDSFKITFANVPAITPASATYCMKYSLPALAYGRYFKLAGGPSTPSQQEYFGGDEINTPGANTLYVWFQNNDNLPGCTIDQPFTITIKPFVELLESDYPDRFGCTSYTLPAAPAGVTYYTGTNKGLPVINPGVITTTTQIFAYKETGGTPNCVSEQAFTVTINNTITAPADVISCSTYNLPVLSYGQYASGPNGTGPILAAGTPIGAGVTTIWFYVPGEPCTNDLSFTITVNIEALPAMPDVTVCDVYYLPAVAHTGDYYTQSGGLGTKRPVNFPITSTQTIYFYDKAPTGPCFVEEAILITVNSSPAIDARPVEVIRCNTSYTLDPLTNGNYYKLQGGPTVAGQLLLDGTTINTPGLTTVWVYAASTETGNTCFQEYKIDIYIFNTVVTDVPDVFKCDSYTLPAIVGPGDYYDAPNGPNGTGSIVPVGTVVTTTTTFYIYAENTTRVACFDEKDLVVTIYNTPVVAPLTPVVQCDSYTLPALVAPATKYFTAANGGGTEKFVGDVITTSQTIYAYAESGTVATQLCFDDEPLVITINNTPVIPVLPPVYACDSYTLPALTAPATKYFTAINGGGTELFVGSVINASTTVYEYAETGTTPNCFADKPLVITIYTTPVVAPLTPVVQCDSYTLPTLIAPATKYFTAVNGGGTEKFVGDVITTSQTIYVYAESGTIGTQLCIDDEPLVITINNTPIIPALTPVFACDSYILPALTAPATKYFTANDGTGTELFVGSVITASTTVYEYAETGTIPNCFKYEPLTITITTTPVLVAAEVADVNVCNSYQLPALSTPGANYYSAPNGGGAMIPAGTIYTTSQLIYAYVANGTAPNQCVDAEDIAINIFNVDEPANVTHCGTYVLPALTVPGAGYYSLPNGVGPITQVAATQNVYVYATAPFGSCSDEYMFTVTINAAAVAYPVPATLTTVCDTDANVDDFVTDFDLDTLTATILGPQNPGFYSVKYYPSLGDANVMTNEIVTDLGPLTDTRLSQIWVRVSDGSVSGCEDIERIVITVIPKPHLEDRDGVICYNSESGVGEAAEFRTGYSGSLYTFKWTDETGLDVTANPSAANFSTTTPGIYTLVISTIGLNGCESDPITFTVIESSRPKSVSIEVTAGWFTENQTIEVTAVPYIGDGSNLRYSLDGGPEQVESIFTNVSSGPHEITVSDINGCGTTPVPVPVQMVTSPKFFSPNGDGINDVWKIAGFEYDPTAKLYIFDRYGKLLKEVFVNNNDGWDGSVNGKPLPGNDYWFTIRYTENNVSKEFKSHFALIR